MLELIYYEDMNEGEATATSDGLESGKKPLLELVLEKDWVQIHDATILADLCASVVKEPVPMIILCIYMYICIYI